MLLDWHALLHCNVFMLCTAYSKLSPKQPHNLKLTWSTWLNENMRIPTYVRIIKFTRRESTTVMELTEECRHISRKHPQTFLGCLRHSWRWDGAQVSKDEDVISELGDLRVPCRDLELRRLSLTYLPVSDLMETWERLTGSKEGPFLALPKLGADEGDQTDEKILSN